MSIDLMHALPIVATVLLLIAVIFLYSALKLTEQQRNFYAKTTKACYRVLHKDFLLGFNEVDALVERHAKEIEKEDAKKRLEC